MADGKKGSKKADPKKVPLGSGLADNAKRNISGRQRQIDDIVDAASGSLQERDMPKKKK